MEVDPSAHNRWKVRFLVFPLLLLLGGLWVERGGENTNSSCELQQGTPQRDRIQADPARGPNPCQQRKDGRLCTIPHAGWKRRALCSKDQGQEVMINVTE